MARSSARSAPEGPDATAVVVDSDGTTTSTPDVSTVKDTAPADVVAAGPDDTTKTAEDAKRLPTRARLPYPHTSLRVPGALERADGGRADLVITREWTDVPEHVVRTVKDTARRAGIKLALLVPMGTEEEA